MNRANLFLTFIGVGLLGAGCGTCDTSEIALYWHFPNPAGTTELTCDQAGVANVVITIDGVASPAIPCIESDVNGNPVQGIVLTNFGANVSYDFVVDGIDASGATAYTTSFTYVPTGCGLKTLDETLTATAGDLSIPYAFQGGGGCSAVGNTSPGATTYIWYQLSDQNGNLYSAVDASHPPTTALACGSGNSTITIPGVAYGVYTLDGIEEVEIDFGGSATVRRYNCTKPTFQHSAAGDVWTPTVVLGAPAAGGPASCF